MKNEEVQRLSTHDEGDHAMKTSVNLNVKQTEPNNNIQHSHQNIGTNTNQTDMEARLKNFNPHQHYHNFGNNFHFHGHHNHMHMHGEISKFDKFRFIILGFIKYINMRIQNLFEGITNTIDGNIRKTKIHPLIKRILHSKQLLLFIYIINIQYLLSSVEKIQFLNSLNKQTLRCMVLSIIGLYVHFHFFKHKLFVEKDEELERFIIKRNPHIKKGICEDCQLLRICRGYHCPFCGKCVKKFQLHSDWFNICIGANNDLLYAITMMFTNLYIVCSNLIFWYYILVKYSLLNYLFLIFFLFALSGVYIIYISLSFYYTFIVDNLLKNLTYFEFKFGRRLTYLWKDERKMIFFNPFDKGIQRNIEELIVNLFDIDIYSGYKNNPNQNLDEIIEDENSKENEKFDTNNFFDDFVAYNMMIKLSEHFEPFLTSKGNIYKFVDGNEIINWNRLIVFSPFDIINCPFKDYMLKSAKMMIERREMYLKSLKQQKQNIQNQNIEKETKKENNEQKENKEEKIDENEEKLDENEEKKERKEEIKKEENEEKKKEDEEIKEENEEKKEGEEENKEEDKENREESKEENEEENVNNNEKESNEE